MRNYSDQEDTETRAPARGHSWVARTCRSSQHQKVKRREQPKPAPAKQIVKKAPVVATPGLAQVVQPVRRNSVELIEGAKRRDVDIP